MNETHAGLVTSPPPRPQACIEHKQPPGVVEMYIDRIPQLEDK